MKTIKGVTIGDQFKKRNDNKKVYTVVSFYKITDMEDNVIEYICNVENDFLGQKIKSTVPFATVNLNKIN